MPENSKEVEDFVRELQEIGRRKPLSDPDFERAKQLMVRLKKQGFTNKEIAGMTAGGWSDTTVKGYTTGVNVVDATAKEAIIALFTDAVKNGLTLSDVKVASTLKKEALRMGVDFPDITQFLSDANQAHENAQEIIQFYKEIKGKTSVAELRQTRAHKDEIEKLGYTPDNLKILSDSVKPLGEFSKVMSILTAYGSLKAVEEAMAKATSAKERLDQRIGELESKIGGLKGQRATIEGELAVHRKLDKEGYSEPVLKELSEMSERFGGVKSVVEAVSTFASLEDMKSKRQGEETKLSGVEISLRAMQADHAHVQSVVSLCDELLYKRGLGAPAITSIFRVAKKFGQPVEVLDAVEKFGGLRAIEAEVETSAGERNRLQSAIREARTELEGLTGQRDELVRSLKDALKPLTTEMQVAIKSIADTAKDGVKVVGQAFQEHLQSYESYAMRWGELNERAGRLEAVAEIGELVAASIGGYSKDLPLRYLKTLVSASYQFCASKDFNPLVKIPQGLVDSNKSLYSSSEAGVKDLLHWAWSGIPDS